MNPRVILRPAAEADIRGIHHELDQLQTGLGDQFAARLREVLERIESMPKMYGLMAPNVRAARLRRYRHLDYYVAFADRVEVLAVMHGSRDRSSWQSRI